MAQIYITFLMMAVLIMSHEASAKRGCSTFGHSCFGGHGKRSGDTGSIEASNSDIRQVGQEETPPHPGYPHFNGLLPSREDIIPVRDGGVYEREEPAARDVMKYRLRNIVKHWMDNYRRSLQNDDGYFVDNL